MNLNLNNETKEYLLYLLLTCMFFLHPFLHELEDVMGYGVFHWEYIFQRWYNMIPFIILIFIHIFFLLPILLNKRKTGLYIILTTVAIGLFFTYIYHRDLNNKPPHHRLNHIENSFHHYRPIVRDTSCIPKPVLIDTLIAVLLLGCSIAIKLMYKHYENTRKMENLKKEQTRQELAQLKAQISPHFLMNSLNNIHGMVEIDPPKAQDMLLELSGMMRYILYESSSAMISLSKEVDFLNNYMSLMRGRYSTRKVDIKYQFPNKDDVASIYIPPLTLITFIENAFKHGISYQNSSFINIELSTTEDKLSLYCRNSLHHNNNEQKSIGGFGLKNIRKRLDILYTDNYSLNISTTESSFIVSLIIPITNEDQMYSNR